ncbi:MerR family transcriptional regulator [Pollutimonas sp. H1-120]|uniref:MerR family transcriptional regulator n=1 Tax=Pollutimonas sp. H1-120 TaxID=3148824 RepID=UPI003B526591
MDEILTINLKMYFSAKEAAQFSRISLAMVNYLCRHRLVVPAVGRKRGRGIERKYSFGDLVILRSVAKLLEAGVSILRLKKALTNLRRLHANITQDGMPASFLVTDGKDVYFRQGSGVLELLASGQFSFAFVLEVESVRRDAVAFSKGCIQHENKKSVAERRVAIQR